MNGFGKNKKAKEPAVETQVAVESKDNLTEGFLEENEGQLTVDVYQTPTHIVIASTIAGVDPENLDVEITRESVTIRGRREREETVSTEDYFYQECYWGKFSRSIILPQEIDADKATAEFRNGILRVQLPKLDKQKVRKMKVKFE